MDNNRFFSVGNIFLKPNCGGGLILSINQRVNLVSRTNVFSYICTQNVQKHVKRVCVCVCIMSMWGSLINAGASSVGEIVILNNEVSFARAVLQQHEYTQMTSRVVCHQASDINPSNH